MKDELPKLTPDLLDDITASIAGELAEELYRVFLPERFVKSIADRGEFIITAQDYTYWNMRIMSLMPSIINIFTLREMMHDLNVVEESQQVIFKYNRLAADLSQKQAIENNELLKKYALKIIDLADKKDFSKINPEEFFHV